jgi:hypothetical protein
MLVLPYTLESPQMCFLCRIRPTSRLYFFTSRHQGRSFEGQGDSQCPSPSSLHQLQSLQGKENFLHRFISNYAELTLGFTRFLKKGSKFVWDTTINKDFEALKLSLTRTPLLFPPDYSRDYFLHLAASDYTIAMVLIQEDDSHDEHVIYYLSWSLTTTKKKYLHVEKLSLAVVQVVQCFRHYILLRKTMVISNCNPMRHILTRQLLGGKFSKWIIILQEFDLEFKRDKSKKSLVFVELICDLPCFETDVEIM